VVSNSAPILLPRKRTSGRPQVYVRPHASVAFIEEHRQWLVDEAMRRDVTISDIVRDAVEAAYNRAKKRGARNG